MYSHQIRLHPWPRALQLEAILTLAKGDATAQESSASLKPVRKAQHLSNHCRNPTCRRRSSLQRAVLAEPPKPEVFQSQDVLQFHNNNRGLLERPDTFPTKVSKLRTSTANSRSYTYICITIHSFFQGPTAASIWQSYLGRDLGPSWSQRSH